jgi:N-carbamoyl-L-amino-acid hydrolase
MNVNSARLMENIRTLGKLGINETGRSRLAASDEDKAGRDYLVSLLQKAGLEVVVDRIGNIYGIWRPEGCPDVAPVMTGSHIDSVINAGQYDGCLGVLSGLEVIRTLQEAGFKPARPIAVVAFTNEEGVRYQPDMMGSLVFAGGQPLDEALDSIGTDGTRLGDELARIGYAGTISPGDIAPSTFVELHIEQGPIMDVEGTQIGVVESLQGIHWKRVVFHGAQNHAGTTPTSMRRDAGLAAAKVNVRMREDALANSKFLCTVGTIALEPNAVNVIPDKATFTVELRSPEKELLDSEDAALEEYLRAVAEEDGLTVESEQLTCFDPVPFDEGVCQRIEKSCEDRGLSHRRITSGAGQDAQMMARICPTAMIFVPSVNGISHNPNEYSRDEDCINGANVLLDVLTSLAE